MRSKERKEKTQKNTKQKNEKRSVWGQVRWPPHLTFKPSRKTHKKNKMEKQKKHKNTKNELFSYQSIFCGCPKFPFFDNLAKKARTQKHYKKRGFSKVLFENRCASRNGHFWTNNQNRNFQLSFFCLFFSHSTRKTQKLAETPIL